MAGRDLAMLLTPAGAAAIAVIRIRGPGARRWLESHFSRPTSPLRCVHGELRDDDGRTVDDPVVILHDDGTTADINLHGGPWVVASTLELLRRGGFEVVEEDIDLLDGRTTLEKEMPAALPHARTEEGVRMLLAQPAAWREFIDKQPSPHAIRQMLEDRCLWHMLHPPRVAIVGDPNVGKSTLANQLFAQRRSITADLPGTTRDWVGEIANIDGLAVTLLDTPGIRDSSDPIEQEAIARAGREIEKADLLLVVREPFRSLSEEVVRFDHLSNRISVMNKADKLGDATETEACLTTATTGEGVDNLRNRIRDYFGCDDLNPARARWWTDRQKEVLTSALDVPSVLKEIYSASRAMS